MSEFIRCGIYRERDCVGVHIEHLVGAMPLPRVVRRREFPLPATEGPLDWARALHLAATILEGEARRLRASPAVSGGASAPPGGPRGETLNLDLRS